MKKYRIKIVVTLFLFSMGIFSIVSAATPTTVDSKKATYISSPKELSKLRPWQIWKDPNSNRLYHVLANTSQQAQTIKTKLNQTAKQSINAKSTVSATPFKKNSKNLTNEEIIDKVKPAIVYIETSYGSGSGMIIESNGLVLTNAHVVSDVKQADVKLSDGRSLSATVVGRDENIDLAVLKVGVKGLPTIGLGNSDNAKQGNRVFAFGFPFGLMDDVSFKDGTISRKISSDGITYLETSAEIHPGNSGGALVDQYGLVIGVNTKIVGQAVKGIILGESIKLAIPINTAKGYIPLLKAGRNITKAEPSTQIAPPLPSTPSNSYCNNTISEFKKFKEQFDITQRLELDLAMYVSEEGSSNHDYSILKTRMSTVFEKDDNLRVAVGNIPWISFGLPIVVDIVKEIGQNYLKIAIGTLKIFEGNLLISKIHSEGSGSLSNLKQEESILEDGMELIKNLQQYNSNINSNYENLVKIHKDILSKNNCL